MGVQTKPSSVDDPAAAFAFASFVESVESIFDEGGGRRVVARSGGGGGGHVRGGRR